MTLGFLADEQRLLEPTDALLDGVESTLDGGSHDAATLAESARRLSVALVRLGQFDRAQQLLLSQVAYANRLGSLDYGEGALTIAIKAYIGMVRLKRIARDRRIGEDLFRLESMVDGLTKPLQEWGIQRQVLKTTANEILRVRILCRNAMVIEACKHYWQVDESSTLLAESERFLRRWPNAVSTGLLHPAEAPFLASPDTQRCNGLEDLQLEDLSQRRLRFIQALHCANEAQRRGEDVSERLELVESAWPFVAGEFLSDATPLRWRGALARILLETPRRDEALARIRDVALEADAIGDVALARSMARALGDVEPLRLVSQAFDPAPVARSLKLADSVMGVFAASAH